MPAKARQTPPRRSAGRPGAGDRDHRAALVDAARDEFARHGFAAASLRRIAAEARVTPALAHYYFGDKAGLLDAVIELRVAPLVSAMAAAVATAGPEPLPALKGFVRAYTATAAQNPWLPQLVVREVLTPDGALRGSFPQRFAGGLSTLLRGLVTSAQARGEIHAALDPAQVVMSVISLCIFPFIAAPMVEGVLGVDIGPARASALADHHLAVLLDGIAGPA